MKGGRQLWKDRNVGGHGKASFPSEGVLMCATNREHVSTLNEGAYQLERSGVESGVLREATGATKAFAITSGEMVEEDYAKTDAAIFQKKQQGASNTRFFKTNDSKHNGSTPRYSLHKRSNHMSRRHVIGSLSP